METRAFSMLDQQRFAALTGDRNPIHMDPLAARRSPFGKCVVHGLHLVLWSLDSLYRTGWLTTPFVALKVDFAQPCLVGDTPQIEDLGEQAGIRRIQVRLGTATLATLSLAMRVLPLSGSEVGSLDALLQDLPDGARALSPQQLEGDAGAYRYSRAGLADAFPDAARTLGEPAVAGLAALSTVVGMLNPGLFSLFSSFTAVLVEDAGPWLRYRADRYSESVRQVTLRVRARGVDANVRAGARPPPTRQLGAADARELVSPGTYAGRRPLIVGGSRGLGEVTAKLLAAGGARPAITYVTGRGDAEAVAAEIRQAGGVCDVIRYDVREPPAPQLAGADGLTGMYFFATSTIYRVRSDFLDEKLLSEFLTAYVATFARTTEYLAQRAQVPLRVFYPSTIAIDEPANFRDFPEYAAAKAAGEVIGAHLRVRYPNVKIIVDRLPRIATDQTATMMPIKTASATEIMRPLVAMVEAS